MGTCDNRKGDAMTPDGMKIKALAPWFGGKRNMAERIVRELGEHRVYWGLCCGSLAVEMVKPPANMETDTVRVLYAETGSTTTINRTANSRRYCIPRKDEIDEQ